MDNPGSSSIVIATRGSALALAQAHQVRRLCEQAFPQDGAELQIIKTTGDKNQADPLSQGALPKGLFTKELEVALLQGEAHLAVHSLKDLPTELPPGLSLGAVLEREDPRDVLIVKAPWPEGKVESWPHELTVATGSPRRREQLARVRPAWKFVEMRGNVGTRLRKLAESEEFEATVLALAGMKRLGFHLGADGALTGNDVPVGLYGVPLPLDIMVPAVGQAAIGIEIPENPRSSLLCQRLNHADTWDCIQAERSFLKSMGGGCHLALAAHATLNEDQLTLRGVSYLSGSPVQGETSGSRGDAEALGRSLARRLKQV